MSIGKVFGVPKWEKADGRKVFGRTRKIMGWPDPNNYLTVTTFGERIVLSQVVYCVWMESEHGINAVLNRITTNKLGLFLLLVPIFAVCLHLVGVGLHYALGFATEKWRDAFVFALAMAAFSGLRNAHRRRT